MILFEVHFRSPIVIDVPYAGDLTTYDHIKRIIITRTGLPDSHTAHILSSICAGLVAAGMGTPADVVKTRVMNQPTDNTGRYVKYKLFQDPHPHV